MEDLMDTDFRFSPCLFERSEDYIDIDELVREKFVECETSGTYYYQHDGSFSTYNDNLQQGMNDELENGDFPLAGIKIEPPPDSVDAGHCQISNDDTYQDESEASNSRSLVSSTSEANQATSEPHGDQNQNNILPHPLLQTTASASPSETTVPIPSDSKSEIPARVSSEVVKYLAEHFPDENEIDLEAMVCDSDLSELHLSDPSPAKYQGTYQFDAFQAYGTDEDKCYPQVELPFLAGPSYEPRIIPYPKTITSQAVNKSSATTNGITVVNVSDNGGYDFPTLYYDAPLENQENVPVSGGTRWKKRNASSRNKNLLKEQENYIRFCQRQEVVRAKNLRPRKLVPQMIKPIVETPPKPRCKPVSGGIKKKRGRPRSSKHLPSSTPLSVKVENADTHESGETSPLTVSPIKLLRRLPTPYRPRLLTKQSSTPTASRGPLDPSQTPTNRGVPSAQPGFVALNSKPTTFWFNPKSTYEPNPGSKEPVVLVADVQDGSSESSQICQVKTEPATVVFTSKNSTTPDVHSLKTETQVQPGSFVKTETFPPNFVNPIKKEKGLRSFRNSCSLQPELESNSEHFPRIKSEGSGNQEDRINKELHNPKSLKTLGTLIKTEPVYLVPNPKAKYKVENSMQGREIESNRRKKYKLKRVRYAKEEYECAICPYKCTVESSLHNHVLCHTNHSYTQPMFSCDVCGLDVASEKDCALHMVHRHKDDSDYLCDQCDFKSGQLKKLIQHRRKHTQEKPHQCRMCSYRTTRRDNLHSHARRIHFLPRMEGDTFTQPLIDWPKVQRLVTINNNNYLFHS